MCLVFKERGNRFGVFSVKRCDERRWKWLDGCDQVEQRTKAGTNVKILSSGKSEPGLKGQIRNHRSGKYRPATFGQIRNHHQTDRDICHFTKFPTTLGYFGKFYSMTKRLVKMSKYGSIYFSQIWLINVVSCRCLTEAWFENQFWLQVLLKTVTR